MLTHCLIWLNALAGAIAAVVLVTVAWLPGWLSATLIAALTGVAMLFVFKHTSNQNAIKATRNQIKANLLALSLFKDDILVALRAQGGLLWGAGQLLTLSLVPMLVMTVPAVLVLGQLSLWYQARPLEVGEEAIVTMRLRTDAESAVSLVELEPASWAELKTGPVRVPTRSMVCWNIAASQPGLHELQFRVGDEQFGKQLAVGTGFMAVSLMRPGGNLADLLLHPHESPFSADSPVQSIEIDYPARSSWTSGTRTWLLYWFAVSMVAAFAARPFLNVNI